MSPVGCLPSKPEISTSPYSPWETVWVTLAFIPDVSVKFLASHTTDTQHTVREMIGCYPVCSLNCRTLVVCSASLVRCTGRSRQDHRSVSLSNRHWTEEIWAILQNSGPGLIPHGIPWGKRVNFFTETPYDSMWNSCHVGKHMKTLWSLHAISHIFPWNSPISMGYKTENAILQDRRYMFNM